MKSIFRIGIVLFYLPAIFGFGEAGRTGSNHELLVYSLLFGLCLIQVGLVGYWRYESSKIWRVSLFILWIGIPFLMISQFVSLLDLAHEVEQNVLSQHGILLPIGILSLGFPVGLMLWGYAINRDLTPLGLGLSISALIMATGLLLTPMIHHIGIILVSICLYGLSNRMF
ncbi:hypothetical protein [Alkalibacillus almallahensis]|uniref:hypothetical protein n=1 Tax=Alkalibacillus almallahensis TaxID=1379154 RepID=UPI001421E52D|nr:hypothetical protein [Alkalibacillus almallahensis]NIK13049.1 hypothetical protein [Alkalibacillus almallahensis]